MLLNTRKRIKEPTKCYLILDPITEIKSTSEAFGLDNEVTENLNVYSGPVRILESLKELNDFLGSVSTSISSVSTDNKLYCGHIFPGSEFPTNLPYEEEEEQKENRIFIIEIIDTGSCFVEEVLTLDAVANSIERDVCIVGDESDMADISNYMVFIGKPRKISYCCYDPLW